MLVGSGKRGARVMRRLGRPDVARDVLEGLMLDRGLRRSYPRAASRRGRRRRGEPYAADARVDLTRLPTFTVDPDDAQDFDDAISARREDGHVRLWVHIADVTAYLRPGGPLEREAFRRGTSVYVPGAVEPMLPEALSNRRLLAAAGGGEAGGDRRDGAARRRRAQRLVPPLARPQRPPAHLRRGRRGVRRAAPAREEPWAEPLEAAREVARALARARDALELGTPEPSFEFDADGHVTGVRYEQQTESHRLIEQLMVLANEQVAGYLADTQAPTLYRVHERPEPQSVGVPRRAAGEPRHPDAAGAEADDAAAGRRRWSPRCRGSSRARRAAGGRYGVLVLRALKQAYYTPAQPRPRRAGQPALLPLHLADPPLPGRGGPPRAAAGARHRPGRRARRTSSTRRACMPRRPSARR